MQYKVAQLMIQEVADGKEVDDASNTPAEGTEGEREGIDDRPEESVKWTGKATEKRGGVT